MQVSTTCRTENIRQPNQVCWYHQARNTQTEKWLSRPQINHVFLSQSQNSVLNIKHDNQPHRTNSWLWPYSDGISRCSESPQDCALFQKFDPARLFRHSQNGLALTQMMEKRILSKCSLSLLSFAVTKQSDISILMDTEAISCLHLSLSMNYCDFKGFKRFRYNVSYAD